VKTRIRNFVLAGSGQVTNEKCGRVSGLYGCLQHEKHEGKGAYVVKLINSCGKPLCPICSKYGWAVRAASLIEDRLSTAIEQKNMGVVEHLVCSAPMDKYDLTYKEFKHKAREILLSIGVNAGVMIFHGIRHKDNPENPNMHVLGFVSGDYDRCRRCKGGDCYACDGARASRANLRSILGSQI
jgi:hypothetical protein